MRFYPGIRPDRLTLEQYDAYLERIAEIACAERGGQTPRAIMARRSGPDRCSSRSSVLMAIWTGERTQRWLMARSRA